jgi:hypothetical protein
MAVRVKKPDDEPGAAWVAIVIGVFVAYVLHIQVLRGILTVPALEAYCSDMTQAQSQVSV